jgi:hypothetical protein
MLAGLDVNARNNYGELPIHTASICGISSVIPTLYAADTRSRLLNNYMESPFEMAKTEEVQEAMVQNGVRTVGSYVMSGSVYMLEENVSKCRAATIALLRISKHVPLCKELALCVWTTRLDTAWIIDDIIPNKETKFDDSEWNEFLKQMK